ncbi:MAG TPA: sugar phosphate isomerase/epimerase [Firmicutes bacterium]|nr:sugar phosphate isomerase/epimerase [Bacillota bacterium]
MKVGCTAWSFTEKGYGAPYEDAIKIVGQMGFKGVELIVWSEEDMNNYYTSSKIEELKRLVASNGLVLSEVAIYDSVVEGLSSLDRVEKEKALENFMRATKIAKELGSPLVNMVAQLPRGLRGPTSNPPHGVIYIQTGASKFSPKLKLSLPEDFDWDAIWNNYVDSIRQCTEIVADHGMKFALEEHCHVIVPHTDSFLRLWDHVKMDALGCNFDTGWQFMQREYLPMSIYKLKDRIFHVHVKDSDGLLSYGLPPGMGIIDWRGVVKALKDVGFNGFLSLELSRYEDPSYIDEGRRYLERVISEVIGC